MHFDQTDGGIEHSIEGWIQEAISEPLRAELPCRAHQAKDAGLFGRIQALRGALRFARTGSGPALDAALSLSKRVGTMAHIYDLRDVRECARDVDSGCRRIKHGELERWADVDRAVDTLQGITFRMQGL
jgi:hypothetical protein